MFDQGYNRREEMTQKGTPVCQHLELCQHFFNSKLSKMPSLATMIKQQFCHDDNIHCARFIVLERLGADDTPADLYPNDIDRGKSLVGLR